MLFKKKDKDHHPFPLQDIKEPHVRELRKRADIGTASAQYTLGKHYAQFKYNVPFMKEAVYWLKLAAKQNNADALFLLGQITECGDKYIGYWEEACAWYFAAAKGGHVEAEYHVGLLQKYENDEFAFTCFKDAAKKGCIPAQYELGYLYCTGRGTTENYHLGWKWIQKSADQNYVPAIIYIAETYAYGKYRKSGSTIIEKDPAKVAELIQQLSSINSTDPRVYTFLGKLYAQGVVLPQNFEKAISCYKSAVKLGNASLGFEGIASVYGNEDFPDKNYATAAYYYFKSIKEGRYNTSGLLHLATEKNCSQAYAYLGEIYMDKLGHIKQDIAKSRDYFKKAADNGNARGICGLGRLYGKCYEYSLEDNGHSDTFTHINRDAIKYFEDAINIGYTEAKYWLGTMYDRGKGVSKDRNKALSLYREAADKGYAYAQHALGLKYEKGEGVNQDYKLAIEWYSKAAKEPQMFSAYHALAHMYKDGLGVEINMVKYYEWHELAAKYGDKDSISWLRNYLYKIDFKPSRNLMKAIGCDYAAEMGKEVLNAVGSAVVSGVTKAVQDTYDTANDKAEELSSQSGQYKTSYKSGQMATDDLEEEYVEEDDITIFSLSDFTSWEWYAFEAAINDIISENIDDYSIRINMSNGSNITFPKMSSYADCLSDIRPADACLVTDIYKDTDNNKWTRSTLFALCYVTAQKLNLHNRENITTPITINDMVCVMQMGNRKNLINNYYTDYSGILCYCDTLEYAKKYISKITNSKTLAFYENTKIEYHTISSLNVHFPEDDFV